MPAPPARGKGKQILGMDPLLFWGLVGAAGLGALYFIFIRKPSANPPGGGGQGQGGAHGPGIISADGAPIMFPLLSAHGGSGGVRTGGNGGGTTSGGRQPWQGGRKHGPPFWHEPPEPRGPGRPKGHAGSPGTVTTAAIMPTGNAHAGSSGAIGAPPAVSPLGSGPYSYAQLEGLWIQAGGSRATAPVAAAVAMAESAGQPRAHNPSGASGLWQILGAPTGWKGSTNWMDPATNARAAVAKYQAAGGWGPWATYPEPALSMLRKGVRPVLPGPAHAAGAAFPGVTHAGFLWPFPTKSPSQFRRIDQGWDLQYSGTKPVPVLAIAPGKVVQLGPDPSGFGQSYPGLLFTKPPAGTTGVYYGHTFLKPGIVGKTVKAGQVIGYTGGPTSGGDAAGTPNWLEIGFLGPGGSYPKMGAGSRIKGMLLHAPTAASLQRGTTIQAAPTHGVHLPTQGHVRVPAQLPVTRPAKPKPPTRPVRATLLAAVRRAAPRPRPRPRPRPAAKRPAPLRYAGRRVR